MQDIEFPTTYSYTPLPSPNHIRLLHFHNRDCDDVTKYEFGLVVKELPTEEVPFDFETVSYTWGAPPRVSSFSVNGSAGVVGLTLNLAQALPHLIRNSETGYLWIDQICINQNDPAEKGQQVSIMDKIYKAAIRVLIWLGPEDQHSNLVKEWLAETNRLLESREDAVKTIVGRDRYNPSIRLLTVRSSWVQKDADPKHALAARRFWGRRWFRRGWICQELLLSKETVFLAGSDCFTMQDVSDLQTLPPDMSFDEGDMEHTTAYNTLINLKRFPFTDPQPLRFLLFMAQVASEFETSVLVDRLCAFLGMLDDRSTFVPDYSRSVRYNFTAFVVSIARSYQSIDFLSLSSAIVDAKIPSTPEPLKNFPTWVPAWTHLPLQAPFRLAAGSTRPYFNSVTWNACLSRPHLHSQVEDATDTERLHVRGRIIDYVETISNCKIDRYFGDVDDAYLDSLAQQIRSDLPGSAYDSWTKIDLVHFLTVVSHNGNPPKQTAEDVLGLVSKPSVSQLVDKEVVGYNEALSSSLSIGRGRRFITTRQGRIGVVPFIGSQGQSDENSASAIVALHGCCVPIVLNCVDEAQNTWQVVGDCYVEGVMHGEAVTWAVEGADTFILV